MKVSEKGITNAPCAVLRRFMNVWAEADAWPMAFQISQKECTGAAIGVWSANMTISSE
jgi:hypothetical protein